jgi:hypothetical protein
MKSKRTATEATLEELLHHGDVPTHGLGHQRAALLEVGAEAVRQGVVRR